ncbi:MAG: hypothetical protein JWR38_4070 [Mucilaginibacter sp.]|nr:hypothetical protein [Mucilaginibacter sp.]
MALTETHQPVNIAIIGGGFCGVLTAIHLLNHQCLPPVHIHLINKGYPIAKGIAYAPHTASLLLNVPNGRMSAFADIPDHYVQWLQTNSSFDHQDELAIAFSTRRQYGNYLAQLWNEAASKKEENKTVTLYNNYAGDIIEDNNKLIIQLCDHQTLRADVAILATGNALPRFPDGMPVSLKSSEYYFEDPWKKGCIENLKTEKDILIIGNGLTMTDTVMGLAENGFKQTIHTISPNGYRLKPWAEAKKPYTDVDAAAISSRETTLLELVKTFNKHRKIATQLNQSIYPIIDSLRPHTPNIWQAFNSREKQQFISYLNTHWGSVRHRIPPEMQHLIEQLRAEKRLITHSGRIISSNDLQDGLNVTLNCNGQLKQFSVQRIINCTGPENHISKTGNKLLNNLYNKGLISAGPCNMGIHAHPENGQVINADQSLRSNLFVIGNNLKGTLWESTAVPELRVQAKKLAQHIISGVYAASGY